MIKLEVVWVKTINLLLLKQKDMKIFHLKRKIVKITFVKHVCSKFNVFFHSTLKTMICSPTKILSWRGINVSFNVLKEFRSCIIEQICYCIILFHLLTICPIVGFSFLSLFFFSSCETVKVIPMWSFSHQIRNLRFFSFLLYHLESDNHVISLT